MIHHNHFIYPSEAEVNFEEYCKEFEEQCQIRQKKAEEYEKMVSNDKSPSNWYQVNLITYISLSNRKRRSDNELGIHDQRGFDEKPEFKNKPPLKRRFEAGLQQLTKYS